jgi:sugar/nucleoside kinase (ribokinase family)
LPGAEITIIGNVALDRVNHGAPTCGGCPAFAPSVLARLHARAAVISACAGADRGFFADLAETNSAVTFQFVESATTSRFELDYAPDSGDERAMVMAAIGHQWSVGDIDRLEIETEWVHLAPLARSDFPAATVARLAAQGHRIVYDGQGLVRVPRRGPLRLDADYDPGLLLHVDTLKIADDEWRVLIAGQDARPVLAALTVVPELVLTRGSRGAEVHTGGAITRIAPPQVVTGVQSTGAGDAFTIGYAVARSRGAEPIDAAKAGAKVAAELLCERKAAAA